ncbi:MAG: formylglycine-generating enzyme family protein [Planctomycetes bacterium]|nr:formylglycine-generating enzyme family protein [Planctomycetota bacterium]
MRSRLVRKLSMLLILLGAIPGSVRGQAEKEQQAEQIAALVKQLGDDKFSKREAARRELEAIGESALPAIRKASLASDDLDYRMISKKLIRTIMLNVRKSKTTGLVMALIDAGDFQMGSPALETSHRADEKLHNVKITRPFLLGEYEVTQEEYMKVMKINPSAFAISGANKAKVLNMDTSRFPVETVSWFDAIEFCNKLSLLDGFEPYYKMTEVKREGKGLPSVTVTIAGGNGYRLPTEAEWEYACRAGSGKPFHFGNYNTGKEANLKPGPSIKYGNEPNFIPLGRTTKVGSYKPNEYSLYDMHGNVAEWCWDWYDKEFYEKSPKEDPQGPDTGTHRVLRGGSWILNEGSCRSASRYFQTPDERKDHAGFRVARSP